MNKQQLKEYYTEIEVKKFEDNIIVINLWKDKDRSPYNFIRLMFAYGQIIYTGDMGDYIFGDNVANIFEFYKGDKINPSYWAEKVYCADTPIKATECDPDKLEELVLEDLLEWFDEEELTEEQQMAFDDCFDYGFDYIPIRAYDAIAGLYSELGISSTDDISYCVEHSRTWNPRYIYACEVLQWVSNNLDEWLKEVQ